MSLVKGFVICVCNKINHNSVFRFPDKRIPNFRTTEDTVELVLVEIFLEGLGTVIPGEETRKSLEITSTVEGMD